MNIPTQVRMICILTIAITVSPLVVVAEGGKNLTSMSNGVTNYSQASPLNNTIGFLQDGDNTVGNTYGGYFLHSSTTVVPAAFSGDPAFSTDQRLKILMNPGEILYYGLRRTFGRDAVNIRIMATIAGVETIIQSTTFSQTPNVTINTYVGTNRQVDILNCGQAGVICTPAQMIAGPAAIVGASGYNALAVSLPGMITTPTDVWVELWDDAGGVCVYDQKDVFDLWDFSVYAGTTEKPGRMHSKFWSFNTMILANRLSSDFALYPAIPDDAGTAFFIKKLDLGGMQSFGFSFVCNATGTLTDGNGVSTTNFIERRKSKNNFTGIRTDIYPQYDIFVNDPDSLYWPSANAAVPSLPFAINTWCADAATGRGSMLATIRFLYPAIIQIFGDLNGVAGYQPLSSDVLFEVQGTTGLSYIYWDGRDGLGNIVPSGTMLNCRFRIERYPVHFPIYDPENNDLGYRLEDRRPFPNGTIGNAYWDDTQIVPGSSSLIGTPSGSGVHPWGGTGTGINAPNAGDMRLMNTWSFGAVRDNPAILPLIFRCDLDNDGIPDSIDIDDDNDGILDKDESPNVDGLLDSDGDAIPDYLDLSFAGYIDVNFDGINDAFDKDGDRIANQFDLDSDNDGIPDVVESYGADSDGDGRIDNYTDTDADGLSQNVDLSNTGETGSVGLGKADLDGDGIPNYIDRDSDNDGIPDIIEAGVTDANNNGLLDDLTDLNGDGVLSPLIGESMLDTDRDGLCNSRDADVDGDGTLENLANAALLTSTDTNGDGRPESYPNKNFDKQGRPNAYDMDSDNDGITDVREAGFVDANNDGISDGITGSDGWDNTIDALASLVLTNTDGVAGFNYADIDADNDGIPDNVEAMSTAGYISPVFTDTDGDGLVNSYDGTTGFGGNGIVPWDQDSDGLPDYLDLDTDGDGVIDLYEGNDFNLNGIADDVPGLSGTDTDGDGLDDFFDNDNTSVKGTSQYMGAGGSQSGDASPGSITRVQRNMFNACFMERDWRCISYVLPINLVRFAGRIQNQKAVLEWSISSTEDLDKMIIERSYDGKSFMKIGEVAAQGSKDHKADYTYTDALLVSQRGYYRIIVVAKSGKQTISNILVLNATTQKNGFDIFPMPVKNVLEASVTITKAQIITVQIVGADGRLIADYTQPLTIGTNRIKVADVAGLPDGVYYMRVQLTNETIVKKFSLIN